MHTERYTSPNPSAAEPCLTLADLEYQAAGWRLDADVRLLSRGTLANRQLVTEKLLWFLRQRGAHGCGPLELRAFLAYLNTAHESAEGRWGSSERRKPLRPSSSRFWYAHLHAFFEFIVAEGALAASPMVKLKPPIARADPVKPFQREQILALQEAAKKSKHRRRDEALILFLLDTGARASEACGLRVRDLDLTGRRCTVLGKGNKHRTLYFGGATTKALWNHLRHEPREPDDPLFRSDSGHTPGEALTRSGVTQLLRRLGRAAGLEAVRCSPHTLRHTFACEFLRAGGNVFTLKELLGHTTLARVNRYVALAQADLENQHRQYSPVDRMKKR